jgi:hypothetical protein
MKQLGRMKVYQPKSTLHGLSLLTSLQLRPCGMFGVKLLCFLLLMTSLFCLIAMVLQLD